MTPTERFHQQHQRILVIAAEISGTLDAAKLARNAGRMADLLAELAALLRVHLAMEDEVLYPRLVRDADARVAKLAQKLQTDMGGVRDEFFALTGRFGTRQAIEQGAEDFVARASPVLALLCERIALEEGDLFDLLG